jgi:hypothetical protein
MGEVAEKLPEKLQALRQSGTVEDRLWDLIAVSYYIGRLRNGFDWNAVAVSASGNIVAIAPQLVDFTWYTIRKFLRSREDRLFCKVTQILHKFLDVFQRVKEAREQIESVETAQLLQTQIARFPSNSAGAKFPPGLTKAEPLTLVWRLYMSATVSPAAKQIYEELLVARYAHFEELIGQSEAPVREKLFALRVLHVCNALQSLAIPTLLLLAIVDESVPNNFKDFKKWQLIVRVRHFIDRKRVAAGEYVFGF